MKRRQEVLASLPVIQGRWPFTDPPDTGCYVSRGLMDGSTVVESVVHDHDGDWQVLDDTDPIEDNVMFVCLDDVVRRHPVVGVVGNLPVGWRADMDFDVPEWVAAPFERDEDEHP
jgi:hypothetical protein